MNKLNYFTRKLSKVIAFILCLICGYVFFQFTKIKELPFDTAYNFISYKFLMDFGLFEYRYGSEISPFDPVASTGPTVNFLIGIVYKLLDDPAGVFRATAVVCALYGMLFSAFFLFRGNTWHKIISYMLLAVLIYASPNLITDGTLFTGLGEMYSVIFLVIGIELATTNKILSQLCGAFVIGFALLTKMKCKVDPIV